MEKRQGGCLFFLRVFPGVGHFKTLPSSWDIRDGQIYKGKSFKRHPSYRSTYISDIKKHGFQGKLGGFRHKSPSVMICRGIQV